MSFNTVMFAGIKFVEGCFLFRSFAEKKKQSPQQITESHINAENLMATY